MEHSILEPHQFLQQASGTRIDFLIQYLVTVSEKWDKLR